MAQAAPGLKRVHLELGGKSPNIFFESVMAADDDFFDKCLEGAALFALNQGEVCTCPSRILVQESIADKFIERVIERTKAIKLGHPLDPSTMIGAAFFDPTYPTIPHMMGNSTCSGAPGSGSGTPRASRGST